MRQCTFAAAGTQSLEAVQEGQSTPEPLWLTKSSAVRAGVVVDSDRIGSVQEVGQATSAPKPAATRVLDGKIYAVFTSES